jgi:hypothetical protein
MEQLMNPKVKKYLKLKRKCDQTECQEEQDRIFELLEEMYYEFDDEEIAYIETKDMDL